MITKEKLLEKVQITPLQGYALYFEEDGQVLEAYNGFKKLGTDDKIDAASNFRLASISKQFIGHAIMKLIADGKLTYETTTEEIFGNMPDYYKDVTIIQMLNHMTGVHAYEEMELKEDRQVLDPDVLDFVRSEKEGYTPAGTEYRYSNTAYVLLGLAIEKLSGQPIEQYVRENVLLPFGMENSYVNREGVSDIPNRVYGTALVDGQLIQRDQGKTSATIGDGGVYSSVNDLNIYLDKFTKLPLEEIYQPCSRQDENTLYSKGLRKHDAGGYTIYYHTGGTCGTHNLLGFAPDKKMRVIFLSNIDNIDASLMLDSIKEYFAGK